MKLSNKPLIAYVPHGIDDKLYYPIDAMHPEYDIMQSIRLNLFKEKNDAIKFVLFFNSRNIRRKQIPDLILAYKTLCDSIGADKAATCALLLHTQPIDENGTNLLEVIENVCPKYNIFFTPGLTDFKTLNCYYNIGDVTCCITSNEGWGLSCTESLMAGTPVIANVTGGLQDQMRFEDENGNWIDFDLEFPSNHNGRYPKHGIWAIPVFPSNRSLQGSVPTPYIFDDRVSFESVAIAMKKWYDTLPDFRETAGQLGRDWLLSDEAKMSAEHLGENIINCIDTVFDTWKPRKQFDLVDTNNYKYKPASSGVLLTEIKLK